MLSYYLVLVKQGACLYDDKQFLLLSQMEEYDLLVDHGFFGIFRRFFPHNNVGYYIYGSVGCGKSFIMDIYFRSTVIKKKIRIHFHDFINYIHSQIAKYSSLKIVSSLLIKKYNLICLDELDIYDIADAMIISELMKYLLRSKIKLIITSNNSPDLLYKNGINRDGILPLIALFEKKFHCYFLDIKNDYRLLSAENDINNFLVGLENNTNKLYNYFDKLEGGNVSHNIFVNGRNLLLKNIKNRTLFLTFDEIFNESYGVNEYRKITEEFDLIIIVDIKCLSNDNNLARRFMIFIDFIYDRELNILCSSEVSIDDLCSFDYFMRTKSRLKELDKKIF